MRSAIIRYFRYVNSFSQERFSNKLSWERLPTVSESRVAKRPTDNIVLLIFEKIACSSFHPSWMMYVRLQFI